MIFGFALATAYIPYLAFMGTKSVLQALLFTTLIPLSGICFIASAFFEEVLYRKLGLSWLESNLKKKT